MSRPSLLSFLALCTAAACATDDAPAPPGTAVARATKVEVCHATASATNPWVVIEVASPSVPTHLGHGDHLAGAFYPDADGDGAGDPGATPSPCHVAGTVDNADDCDDTDAGLNPDDADGDGASTCEGDCDDTDAGLSPADADGDGVSTCDGDCDDADASLNPADADGDGLSTCDGDCDDADATAFPGAVEVCDHVDNDCDGVVDGPDALGGGTWYTDADGDGFGAPGTGVEACEQPSGTADNGGDCDDADAGVSPAAAEVCNGQDDDCDGIVDEGSADTDGDGVYDCEDDTCGVSLDAGGETPIDETCLEPDITVTDPWNTTIEWQWGTSGAVNSYVTPKVGNLTDTDGDGDVDTNDTPNVLVSTYSGPSGPQLTLLEGDTGAEVWTYTGVYHYGENALADVDGDGETDVVSFDSSRRPILLDRHGNLVWTGATSESLSYPELTVADIDADGVVEVITNRHVFDGQTGALETTFTTPSGIPYYAPAVGDIDLDGEQEVIVGNQVFSPDGTLEWTGSVTGGYGHWSALVDVDGDPEGEVLMVGGSKVAVFDHDGTELVATTTTAAAQPGPICVADFDGDGTVEAAWASNNVFSVYELDATRNWSATINDSSGLAGCSAYDFDGDGIYEILFADQNTFWVFDGATGAVLFSEGGHNSGTLFEYPVVADADNDGSAEILYVSNFFASGWATLTVLGHYADGWPRSGATWPVHDFAATNVLADGSVPTDPDPSWSVYNVYRARPSVDTAATNLTVDITDTCTSSCDTGVGTVSVAVSISNSGGADIVDDIDVSLVDVDSGTVLQTLTLSGGLGAGETSSGLAFTVAVGDIGASGVQAVVDDASLLDECDESDNDASWTGPTCP